jgi:hypothetical protein
VALSTTVSAPTFFSAISWMALKTVEFGAIDQTWEPFRPRIALTVPVTSIWRFIFPHSRRKIKIEKFLALPRLDRTRQNRAPALFLKRDFIKRCD